MPNVIDLLGSSVVVGDQVAGAFRIGNTATLRVGTVIGYGWRADKQTVRVLWHNDANALDEKIVINGAIEADLRRFVKIGSELVPADTDVAPGTEDIAVANP